MHGDVIVDGWKEVEKSGEKVEIIGSEPGYLECLEAVIDNTVIFSAYEDFDNDGICEMFALVGDEKNALESDKIEGELWFVNQEGAKRIEYRKMVSE